jgi:cyclohexanecarboxylate-CoA ligase
MADSLSDVSNGNGGDGFSCLWGLVVWAASTYGTADLARDQEGRCLTFAGLKTSAEAKAVWLSERGFDADSTASWQLPSALETIALAAALALLGVRQNPIIPNLRESEVAQLVHQAQSDVLIVPRQWRGFDYGRMASKIAAALPKLEVILADDIPRNVVGSVDHGGPLLSHQSDPASWLFFTSGTTATPKGVRHTDRALLAAGRGYADRLSLDSTDRLAIVFPFAHVGGPINLCAALMSGARLLVSDVFEPADTIPFLAQEGVTLGGVSPVFQLAYLAAQRQSRERVFPTVRGFPTGGAARPPDLHRELERAFGVGVLPSYGLTEAPVATCCSPSDAPDMLAHSEGRPLPGIEIEIVNDDGIPCRTGQAGAILLYGPQVMGGYLDSALDGETFDVHGYLRTGDVGYLNDDGYLIVTGRSKDIIIRNGENISAYEVEQLILAHLDVEDVAVIGLPDSVTGERCCAVIVLRDGAVPTTRETLVQFLRDRGVASFKLPQQVEIVDNLPRNPSGKTVKSMLVSEYATDNDRTRQGPGPNHG